MTDWFVSNIVMSFIVSDCLGNHVQQWLSLSWIIFIVLDWCIFVVGELIQSHLLLFIIVSSSSSSKAEARASLLSSVAKIFHRDSWVIILCMECSWSLWKNYYSCLIIVCVYNLRVWQMFAMQTAFWQTRLIFNVKTSLGDIYCDFIVERLIFKIGLLSGLVTLEKLIFLPAAEVTFPKS